MVRELNDKRSEAQSGKTDSVVVFLHGYGADGADLLGLSEVLETYLPNTAFRAPDAPENCAGNPMGYQWFPIPWIDGSSEEAAKAGMLTAQEDLSAYLEKVLDEEGLTPDRMVLVGFSQGSMMAMHYAPRQEEPVAGVVAFSGRLLEPENLAEQTKSRPPILLLHGDVDEVVPFASMEEAGQALSSAGFETYAHVMKGTGHGIANDGLSVALAFMRDALGLTE